MPDIMLCFLMLYTSTSALLHLLSPTHTFVLDGVTTACAWLYLLKLFTHDDDYHVSFLIKQSYVLVGRLFISFGPIFIGFVLFAHAVFCRYSDLFVSFHKAFVSLFCISYYNMTYEGYKSTEKQGPVSAIFFTTFVLLFTACVYSGMLVSVFCSYVWNKRDQKNKQELVDSLKIECGNCQHKYMYREGAKMSQNNQNFVGKDRMLETLAANILGNRFCRAKYKEIIIYRLKVLARLIIEDYLEDLKDILEEIWEEDEQEEDSQYTLEPLDTKARLLVQSEQLKWD